MTMTVLSQATQDHLRQLLDAGDSKGTPLTQADFAGLIKSGELPVDGHMSSMIGMQNLLETAFEYQSDALALALLDDATFLTVFDDRIKFHSSTWSIPVLERVLQLKGPVADALARERWLNNWLISSGPEDVVLWFIKQGMSLDSALDGNLPYIPLHRYAGWLNWERFEFLLRLGADPYTCDAAGRYFLHAAVDGNFKTIAPHADRPEHLEQLRQFLEGCNQHGLDLSRPDAHGRTALQLAFDLGYTSVAAELIRAGAGPRTPDHDNKISLNAAAVTPPEKS